MEETIVILLIISTVLACWSFSLFLRLMSEYVARKRQRLRSEHHRKGIARALVAMGLGIIGSAVSGWFAFDIVKRTSDLTLEDDEIVTAVIFGLALFASMLLIWAIIGDRSRGRLRCPRCCYAMEGIDTPQCPECGKAIKSDRHLRKARRMKWPFGLACLLVGFATYGFVNLERVEETDAFALMPTWVLMLGWDVLPEDWVIQKRFTYDSPLSERLYDLNAHGEDEDAWVSEERTRRFLRKLVEGYNGELRQRWDRRRTALIWSYTVVDEEYFAGGIFAGVDSERMMQGIILDLYHAIRFAENGDPDALLVSEQLELSSSLLIAAQAKKLRELELHDPFVRGYLLINPPPAVRDFLPNQTFAVRDKLDPEVLYQAAMRGHPLDDFASALLVHSEHIKTIYQRCMTFHEPPEDARNERNMQLLIGGMEYFDAQEIEWINLRMKSWLLSSDPTRVHFVLMVLSKQLRLLNDDDTTLARTHSLESLIKIVRNELIFDDRKLKEKEISISDLALSTLIAADPSNPEYWELAAVKLDYQGECPVFIWIRPVEGTPVIQDWIERFRLYAESHDPKLRLWFLKSLPATRSTCFTEDDPRFMYFVAALKDTDDHISEYAELMLNYSYRKNDFGDAHPLGWRAYMRN